MTLGCRLLRSLFLGSGGLEIGRIEDSPAIPTNVNRA
jgi:hypothetical protein